MDQLHFLMFPLMSQSHIIPLTDFAKLLGRRGALISIVTTPLNATRYQAIIDQSRAQNLKIQMIPIKFPCQEAGLPDGCENMDTLNSIESVKKFFQAFQLMQAPMEKLIQELEPKPNCIVSTTSISLIPEVAKKFNIPWYHLETISCFTLLVNKIYSQSNIAESVVSDSETFFLPGIPHKIEFTKAQLAYTRVTVSGGLMKKPALGPARGTLLNSFQELEPWYIEEYRKERENVWCIGPVSLTNREISERLSRGNKSSIDEHFCLSWLDSMKPKSVVYACFGSLCHISLPQIKEIGLGLEASSFPFIWIIRKLDYSAELEKWLAEEGFEERVRGRGLVIRGWAPQVLILSHPSVGGFLMHCGWNSTLESVCAGVPIITWPMFAEQFYNEKFVVDVLGIGVRVGDAEKDQILVKWDQVKNAVENLMDESEDGIKRRERAEELAKLASNAVEEGGSSYLNVTMFIQDVMKASPVVNSSV